MKKILSCFIAMLPLAASAITTPFNPAGSWTGTLEVTPQMKLRLNLNINDEGDGFIVTLDSPDQGAFKIPMTVDYLENDSISVAVRPLQMAYSGRFTTTDSGRELKGVFTQAGMQLPLTFQAGKAEMRRPQTPKPPFTYSWKEVKFENKADSVTLSGTLTLPEGMSETTPVVLLVSGSGLQNRDEELFGHRPFAVIADHLARIGIASLRYDDRGFGASTGDGEKATTADFTADAQAGLKWLREEGGFRKVGILGHSEGGMIAFKLAAEEENRPDFVITIGAPGVDGEKVMRSQLSRHVPDQTMVDNAIADMKAAGNPWLTYFFAYDPIGDIAKTKVPALALYGSLDTQVDPILNVPPIQKVAPGIDIKVYQGLNHLMQHAETGDPTEYGQIEETIAFEVLSDIARFIMQQRGI